MERLVCQEPFSYNIRCFRFLSLCGKDLVGLCKLLKISVSFKFMETFYKIACIMFYNRYICFHRMEKHRN